MYTEEEKQRFYSKLKQSENGDGCLEFDGARKPTGYGNVWVGGRCKIAHRVAWEMHFGPIDEGLVVMHKCDNPPCCNINHLLLGTLSDNTRDMMSKRRDGFRKNRATGERNGMSKLTKEQVEEIKSLMGKETQEKTAARFNVNQTSVSRIQLGRTRKNG
jgi:hypothetical protein